MKKPNIAIATPYTTLIEMGIMQGGAYFPDGDPKDNFFGVKASLAAWPSYWLMTDKKGWLQWWEKYCQGRRLSEEDEMQIERWQNFGRRHLYGLYLACVRDNTTIRNRKHWAKAKQALLHWGINAEDPNVYTEFCGDLLLKRDIKEVALVT